MQANIHGLGLETRAEARERESESESETLVSGGCRDRIVQCNAVRLGEEEEVRKRREIDLNGRAAALRGDPSAGGSVVFWRCKQGS
jgi:hypothetical protein